jgi:hypothetical protein
MTAALLDRLTHRCHLLEMSGESYRYREGSGFGRRRFDGRRHGGNVLAGDRGFLKHRLPPVSRALDWPGGRTANWTLGSRILDDGITTRVLPLVTPLADQLLGHTRLLMPNARRCP